jgi:signal transduction histidine kinase
MNACFLNFSDNADNNIRQLTSLCRELLNGDFVLYDRFCDDTVNSPVHCQIPYDLSAENRNWRDRFSAAVLDSVNHIIVIRKLQTTKYAGTDPNVLRYNLQTCMGKAITDGVTPLGSLSLAYRSDFSPDEMDRKIMGIITSAIQVEEKRNQAKAKMKSSEKQLRALSSYLQSVREKERSAFAREVHDELGQILTALKMELHWIGKRFTKDQKPIAEKIRTMTGMTDTAIQTVQKIASELRPSILDDLGLQAAMEWQSRAFERRTDIHTEATFDLHETGVSRDVSTALFRIYQEALTNIVRHAHATEVRLSLKSSAGMITMAIQDNGRGIHEKQVSAPNSFGLMGMRERVYSLGGDVTIHGNEMMGTGVTITIPLTVKEMIHD